MATWKIATGVALLRDFAEKNDFTLDQFQKLLCEAEDIATEIEAREEANYHFEEDPYDEVVRENCRAIFGNPFFISIS